MESERMKRVGMKKARNDKSDPQMTFDESFWIQRE